MLSDCVTKRDMTEDDIHFGHPLPRFLEAMEPFFVKLRFPMWIF